MSRLFSTDIFIWDTETTGNKPLEDDIISLGGVLVTFDPHTKMCISKADFHTYIDTYRQIDTVAQEIHHISKSDLSNQPRFPEALQILETFLCSHHTPNSRIVFMAHNGSKFDNIILYTNCVAHRINFDDFLSRVRCHGFVDSLCLLKALFKNSQHEEPCDRTKRVSYALGACYTSFCNGKTLEGAHDALTDSRGLLEIMNSSCVSSKMSLTHLFKYVIPREKAVKQIKQSAGMTFQNREDHTRQIQVEDEEKKHPALEPIYDTTEVTDACALLCLNCMKYVTKNKHIKCGDPTSSLSKNFLVNDDMIKLN